MILHPLAALLRGYLFTNPRALKAAFVAVMAMLALLVLAVSSGLAYAAFVPPANAGPVTDPGGQLSAVEQAALSRKIFAIKAARGYEIAVFLPTSLEGEAIEDVAYHTARSWKLGAAGKDDGVLLVIATQERKIRIESGKGVGGALTDIQANRISREQVGSRLKQGQLRLGIEEGIDAIDAALATDIVPGQKRGRPAPKPDTPLGLIILAVVVLVPLGLFILIAMAAARAVSGVGSRRSPYGDSYSVGGGGFGGPSSWGSSSSPSDSGWGGGSGGGGGDFGGGGGDFGGGGGGSDY